VRTPALQRNVSLYCEFSMRARLTGYHPPRFFQGALITITNSVMALSLAP